uniref:Wd repeat-containing protein 7 isoform x1 n=1 Tax=Triatoma infestans TaxID=30076 RepID=A0A170U0C1_TRIIF
MGIRCLHVFTLRLCNFALAFIN